MAMADAAPEKKPATAQASEPEKMVTFAALFRTADQQDKVLVALGTLASCTVGMAMPVFSIIFGRLMNDFNDPDKDRVLDKAIEMSYIFLIIAAAAWLSAAVGLACWMYVAERITKRVREDYVRAVLRQEMAWFDKNKAVEMSARLSADSIVLLGAIGEKIMSLCMNSVVFIGGVIIGLVRGWQLALLVLGVTPIIGVCVGVLMGFLSKSSERVQSAYAKAGGVAEEAFASIRTVSAFSGEDTEYERYARELKPAFDAGVKKGLYEGIAFGGMNLTFFGAYALCLWFGAFLIRDKITNAWSGNAWTGGEVMTVFFAVLMGAFSLGQIGPSMQAIAAGRAAAYRLYEVIDRVPPIDVLSEGGAKFDNLRANVEFRDVHFRYPTRDEVSILRGLSFSVRAGQTVALVGTSGCGKSTALALLERFYDVDRGAILVDGHDLRELNVAWWRQQVAMVSQEPVLFDATIEDNIRFGKPDATREEIEAAAKLANAHAFINTLPDKYKTMCGEGGSQLSGGQKQRIAIARAIVRNPKLLLLDEATSALDSKSEREVQEALERVMEGRTTIVVAHRLSTIVNADCIFVIDRGVLVEQGTHAELTARNGVYANLVRAQEAANRSLDDDMDGVDVEEKKAESELRRDPSLKKATSEARPRSGSHAERSKKLSGTATGAGEGTKGEEEEDETAKLPDPGAAGVLKLISQQSLGFLLLGFLGGGLSGVVLPLWGLVFSEIVNVFYITDAAEQREQAMWWSLAFLGLGLLSVAAEMLKSGSMGVVGERLTLDLRQKVFRNLLRQDMTFFDRPENSSGLLALRLSSDATMVQAGVSYRSALLLQLNATFITGLIVSFVASWKMSLVVLAVLPLLAISSGIYMKLLGGFSTGAKAAFEEAGRIASEAISNNRTVASFAAHERVVARFQHALSGPLEASRKSSIVSGVAFGFSQGVIFAQYALNFWWGGYLISDGEIDFQQMLQALFGIVAAAMVSGQVQQVMPDVQKAVDGRKRIFHLLSLVPQIDSASPLGARATFTEGRVEFKDVHFTYPNRPDTEVLRGVSVSVERGQTLALVGPSGSGKSTLVSLLLRFYDAAKGSVTIDGVAVKDMNVAALRAQLGLVSQEPRLFDASVEENIRYGNRLATEQEVVEAALKANVHGVIMGFPDGYKTTVGPKGSKISGGQKQRIAIARALIRKPKVLLLDEATSALDSESEKVVQEALEKLMAAKSQTVIIVAHRLSTIRNADIIAVLDKGAVVEVGNHESLVRKGGVYASLVRAMSASNS